MNAPVAVGAHRLRLFRANGQANGTSLRRLLQQSAEFTHVLLFSLMLLPGARAGEDFSGMRGANYVPSYARNDVQTWMDYDGQLIDRELGYAERLQLNTVRVFLQVAVWEKDSPRFLANFEDFLQHCERHHIQMMPVLFDSCFGEEPDLVNYRQKDWVASPGYSRLDPKQRPALERYVREVVGAHRQDARIILWDVMNEPESTPQYNELAGRVAINDFVRWSLKRVKEEKPLQPLTVGWAAQGNTIVSLELADVICLHRYGDIRDLRHALWEGKEWARLFGKPVILNEFVGRPQQPIEDALPVVADEGVGWCFWELMVGNTQFARGKRPYQGHIYPDGTCYSAAEVAAILYPRGYTAKAEDLAAKAGFAVSSSGPKPFSEEGIGFTRAWERWSGQGPANGRLWYTSIAGESATKTVRGTRIAVVLKHGPDCGIATVTVDGQPVSNGRIDAFQPEVE